MSQDLDAIDHKWFERFAPLSNFPAIVYLNGSQKDVEEQERLFLANQVTQPNLTPTVDETAVKRSLEELGELQEDISAQETEGLVREAYIAAIEESRQLMQLVLAAAEGASSEFLALSTQIYGAPEAALFEAALSHFRFLVEQYGEQGKASELSQQILGLLPAGPAASLPTIPETVFNTARQLFQEEFHDLLNYNYKDGRHTAEEMRAAFLHALKGIGADDWDVIIDPNNVVAIHINQVEKHINIPASRTVSSKHLRYLVVHEVGTHVARRVNGEKSRLKLLGLGLQGFMVGEEGVATVREQLLRPEPGDYPGLEKYVAIGLALGLDGTPRSFRDIYALMKLYFTLRKTARGRTVNLEQRAHQQAWGLCLRLFRGTTGETPGVCLTKDHVYFAGNMGIWKLITADPHSMSTFNQGKFDPSSPHHQAILTAIA